MGWGTMVEATHPPPKILGWVKASFYAQKKGGPRTDQESKPGLFENSQSHPKKHQYSKLRY